MKSILNDVNCLEKAWDILRRLSEACNNFAKACEGIPIEYPAAKEFNAARFVAKAFIEKYGEKPNPVCKCGRMV
jgi:hypothetical protein